MSLIELISVVAILSIILGLTASSYHSFSTSVELINGVQQVTDVLNAARQIATSQNEYVQVRFFSPSSTSDARNEHYTAMALYRAESPFYGSETDYQTWATQKRFRQTGAISRLPGNCIVVQSDTYGPTLKELVDRGHAGECRLPDGSGCEWVGFYFKPDGSTDLGPNTSPCSFAITSFTAYRAAKEKLPANYAIVTVDPVSGRFQLLRP